MPSPAPHPERIGKYTITQVLGRGAMGVVFKGLDPHIQRPVAIKMIHKELLGDAAMSDTTARFRNEAQAVGRIQHPGIVAIYEFGEDDDSAYIAMEYVDGQNLDQVLKANPRLPAALVRSLMVQLLDALHCAHQAGVWHRDIKPANLILNRKGQLKLTDFGIARIENAGVTQVASSIGTPGYMAPEQYIGEGIDQRADIFAAGALYYRLLSGVPAFAGTQEAVMYKVFNQQPTPLSSMLPGQLPQGIDALLERALAKKPEERFASALEFREAIARLGAPPARAALGGEGDATVIRTPTAGSLAQQASQASQAASARAALALTEAEAATLPLGTPAVAAPMAAVRAVAPHSHFSQGSQASQSSAAQTLASSAISSEMRLKAQQLLARVLGPIARVLVKRAADRAGDQAQFLALLLEGVEGEDRELVRAELKNLR